MAISYQEFLAKTKAERVAGQLIVGIMGKRQVVGTYKGGVLNLTDAGKEYLANLEPEVVEEKPKKTRKKNVAVQEEVINTDADLEKLLAEDD
jgi:hypothetical protein